MAEGLGMVMGLIGILLATFAIAVDVSNVQIETGSSSCSIPFGVSTTNCVVNFTPAFKRTPVLFVIDSHPAVATYDEVEQVPLLYGSVFSPKASCTLQEWKALDCFGGTVVPSGQSFSPMYLFSNLNGAQSFGIEVFMNGTSSGAFGPSGSMGWLQWSNGNSTGASCDTLNLYTCTAWYDLTPKVPLDGSKGVTFGNIGDFNFIGTSIPTGSNSKCSAAAGVWAACFVNSTVANLVSVADPSWSKGPSGSVFTNRQAVRFVVSNPQVSTQPVQILGVWLVKHKSIYAHLFISTLSATTINLYLATDNGMAVSGTIADTNWNWEAIDPGCLPGQAPSSCRGWI